MHALWHVFFCQKSECERDQSDLVVICACLKDFFKILGTAHTLLHVASVYYYIHTEVKHWSNKEVESVIATAAKDLPFLEYSQQTSLNCAARVPDRQRCTSKPANRQQKVSSSATRCSVLPVAFCVLWIDGVVWFTRL